MKKKPTTIADVSDTDLEALKESLQTINRMIFQTGLYRLGLEKSDEKEVQKALKIINEEIKKRNEL